jgi:hypothetical protein
MGSVRALLATMVVSAGGCVIPIAPEFESEANLPPYVKTAEPPVGTTVMDRNQFFRVTVEDPNRADNLYVAWLIDYPPYAPNTRVGFRSVVPSDGPDEPNEHLLNFLPSCELIAPGITDHRLMLAVSDRPFEETIVGGVSLVLDKTAPGAHALRVTWNFEKPCQ